MDNISVAKCNGKKHCENNPIRENWMVLWSSRLFGKCKGEKSVESRDSWLRSYGLLKSEDVPPDLREMHLLVGYRPIPSSSMYCFKSIFYPTNETLNIWTHFVALLILVNRFYTIFMHKIQGPLSDPLYYPLWVYAFGTCLMLAGSCVAHLFCSYSRSVRDTCWCCDYASVTLSFLGSSIVYHNYVCPYECMEWPINNYLRWLGIGGVIGHAACCYSRRITSNVRYALRSSVFVLLYIGTAIPCDYKFFVRALLYFNPDRVANDHMTSDIRCNLDTTNFMPIFTLVNLFCTLTVFFNVAKIPERWFPGTFDIIGHSHQWMHINIALAFYTQTFMIEGPLLRAEALKKEGALTLEDLDITWSDTVGTMTFVALSCMVTSWLMSRRNEVLVQKKAS